MPNNINTLQQLLPQGFAWQHNNQDTNLYALLVALAIELDLVEAQLDKLRTQLHPNSATELLPDWLAMLALPDTCTQVSTVQELQGQAWERYIQTGGTSAVYFIALAASLGYPITIADNPPFRANRNTTGQPLNGGQRRYSWTVTAPLQRIVRFTVGISRTGDPLLTRTDGVLECILNRLKPAHTQIEFKYIGALLTENSLPLLTEQNLVILLE